MAFDKDPRPKKKGVATAIAAAMAFAAAHGALAEGRRGTPMTPAQVDAAYPGLAQAGRDYQRDQTPAMKKAQEASDKEYQQKCLVVMTDLKKKGAQSQYYGTEWADSCGFRG